MRRAQISTVSLLAVLVLLMVMGAGACGGGNGGETALPGEEEEEAPPSGEEEEEEVTYKEVTVDAMTVSIPTEWQRPEDIDEILRDAVGTIGPEDEQYFPADGYEPPAEDVALILAMTKMSELVESEGGTWEGWEAQMEAWGMTEEEAFSP